MVFKPLEKVYRACFQSMLLKTKHTPEPFKLSLWGLTAISFLNVIKGRDCVAEYASLIC